MELRDVAKLIWKRRWTVVLTSVAIVVAAAAFAFASPKRYDSTATIALTPDASRGANNAVTPDNIAALLGTYVETAKSLTVEHAAGAALGHKLPGTLSTSDVIGTGILQITDEASAPQPAADAAAADAAAFMDSLRGNGLVIARLVSPPIANATPVQPRPPVIIAVAVFLGLLSGCALALGLEHFRQRVETADDVAEISDTPVLGHVPYKRSMARNQTKAIAWAHADSMDVQESMRALRTNLQLLSEHPPRSILVTSSSGACGKSTLVANLGIALARAGIETLIVDADMRSPRQHEIFGLDNSHGLSVLLENWSVNKLPDLRPQSTGDDHLSVLTAGPPSDTSTELLHTRLRPILTELSASNGVVLIDSPPLLPVADARIIATEADATILVVDTRTERPIVLRNAFDKLELAHAMVIGIVLNKTAVIKDGRYDGGYGY